MKLTNAKLKSLPIGRKVSDGGGLYYQPTANNKGKWSYRFNIDGKSHEMGLGTYPEISLKEARLMHAEQRKLFVSGKNPIETRRQKHKIDGKYGDLIPDIPPGMNYSYYTEKLGHPNPKFAWRSKFSVSFPPKTGPLFLETEGGYDGSETTFGRRHTEAAA